MKIKQRALSLLLSLAMVLTFMPVLSLDVFADSATWVDWDERYDSEEIEDGALSWYAYANRPEVSIGLNGYRWISVGYEVCRYYDEDGWEYFSPDDYSYQWYKGNTILSEQNDYEYCVREAGTYKCIVTITVGEDTKTESVEVKVNPLKKGNLSLNASNQAMAAGTYYEIKSTTTSLYQFTNSNTNEEEIIVYEGYEEDEGETYYEDEYYIYGTRAILLRANRSYYLYCNSGTKVSIAPLQMGSLTAGALNQAVEFDKYYTLKTPKTGDYIFSVSSVADNYYVRCRVMDEDFYSVASAYSEKESYDSKVDSETDEYILKANKLYYVYISGSSTNNKASISIEKGELAKARDDAEANAGNLKKELEAAKANLATAQANYNTLKASSNTSEAELKKAKEELQKARNEVLKLKAKARTTKGLKASAKEKGKVALSWKKTKGAKGYQIYRSTNKKSGFKKVATIKKVKKTKWADKKANKGKTYFYKIRPYNVVAGKKVTGQWSAVVKVKTKQK